MESILTFTSFDGTRLQGAYLGAPGDAQAAAILVHGITSSRDELGLFSGLASHLASKGVPSFRFDYRCHGNSTQPRETMTLAGIANDIEAAAAVALAQAGASNIHAVGMSFGGGVTAYWAARTEIAVRSVVMLAPVIDYEHDILGQHGALVSGGLSEECAARLARDGFLVMDDIPYGRALLNEVRFISGIEGLRRLKCDSLIIHGDEDSIVPYALSEKFVDLSTRCRLINIPGTDHGFGVGDDEDLSSPETKEKHRQVFAIISDFYEQLRGA